MKKTDTKDYLLLFTVWILTLICLLLFIPRDKLREASVAFHFKQLLTWLFGLIVVNFKLLEYPVRLFKSVNSSSFTFEYFVFPSICVFFNVYYPEQAKSYLKVLYHLLYSSFLTGIEVLFERNTNLVDYKKWNWSATFATVNLTFFLSRLYYFWFFKEKIAPKG
ncbi:CBO0543 family protein [Bacillus solitudinis]|uniref:CBO0543 family protein n=1 Tax=Bacillus solitudinis TaxID=2014074 RepID=UPI0018E28ADD|nr:CBO0543 family protein [Bacillus solitudinis]